MLNIRCLNFCIFVPVLVCNPATTTTVTTTTVATTTTNAAPTTTTPTEDQLLLANLTAMGKHRYDN